MANCRARVAGPGCNLLNGVSDNVLHLACTGRLTVTDSHSPNFHSSPLQETRHSQMVTHTLRSALASVGSLMRSSVTSGLVRVYVQHCCLTLWDQLRTIGLWEQLQGRPSLKVQSRPLTACHYLAFSCVRPYRFWGCRGFPICMLPSHSESHRLRVCIVARLVWQPAPGKREWTG